MAHAKFPVEVLTPEGEVFNDEVEMVSTRDRRRLDRRPRPPRSRCWRCSTRPSCACTRPSPRSSGSPRPRATCRWPSNQALILVEEAHAAGRRSTPASCASACSRPSASSSPPARTPRTPARRGARQAPLGGVSADRRGHRARYAGLSQRQLTALILRARCLTSVILAERLISYDTSRPEELVAAAGFVKGWLESRDIEVRDHDHNGLPVLVAEVGPARRAERPVRRLPRPSRRRARPARSSSSRGSRATG